MRNKSISILSSNAFSTGPSYGWEVSPETKPLTMHKIIERVDESDLLIAEQVHRDWSSLVTAAPDLLKAAMDVVDLWHNAGWPEAQIFQRLEKAIEKATRPAEINP